MAGFVSSANGGGSRPRGGFVGPVRRPVVRAAPRAVTSSRPVSVMPKADFTTHYDPSRVIDLDRLKVVQDMRAGPEFGEGRGDTTSGDNGVMSPSEAPSGTMATGAVRAGEPGAPGTGKIGGGGLALAAIAAYLLLGG